MNLWSDAYQFDLVNAESCSNISARYQDRYQSDSYDLILAFCDTDRRPEDGFELIRTKINKIFGNDIAADKVIIFVNPCTMQVILMHFGAVNLQTHNKHKNSPEIQRLTGLESLYKGSQEQRGFIFSQITKDNYQKMKEAISEMSVNYKERPSTNFLYYLNCFESSDTSWIDEINNLIEAE